VTVRSVHTAAGQAQRGRVAVKADPGHGATVVRLSGEFDIETVPSIEKSLRRALGPFYYGEHLIIDLSETTFIDSTFIRFLVELASRTRRGGREVVLVRPVGHVRAVLLLVGMPNLVPVYDSLERAVHNLRFEESPLIPPPLPWEPRD